MKTVIEMAREADKPDETCWLAYEIDFLERFAEIIRADAIADEREACASECDEWIKNGSALAEDISSAIRARGNT